AALSDAKLAAKMILQVHDELIFEVPEAEVEKTTKVVKEIMEGAAEPAIHLTVPIDADTGVGDTWADAH
ncbi:MAG: DNA polymerase, partial [Limibacillus sp.]